MKRNVAGYAGALISVIMFLAGLILSTFGLILMGHPMAGLFLLVPGVTLLAGGIVLFRKSLSF